jgi:hypothetical protein
LSAWRTRCRLQRSGAEANPTLQMAGAGLYHHTGVISVGAHEAHRRRIGTIQIHQSVARVLVFGVRVNVHVAPPQLRVRSKRMVAAPTNWSAVQTGLLPIVTGRQGDGIEKC